jgi:hypothetical protein
MSLTWFRVGRSLAPGAGTPPWAGASINAINAPNPHAWGS